MCGEMRFGPALEPILDDRKSQGIELWHIYGARTRSGAAEHTRAMTAVK